MIAIVVRLDGSMFRLELPIAMVRDALRCLRHSGVRSIRDAAREASRLIEVAP